MARTTIQPTYDFLAAPDAASGRPPRETQRDAQRETLRQTSAPIRDDSSHEELRAQLKRFQYELEALRTERELSDIQHQQELKAIHERAENDFKRAQSAQNGGETASRKLEALQREHSDVLSRSTNEKLALEKKIRDLQADTRHLREELEETQAESAESNRRLQHDYTELLQRYDTNQGSVEEKQADLEMNAQALKTTQQRLARKQQEYGELEAEVMQLRSQTVDTETPAILRKELSEQVNYIQKLEGIKRSLELELKGFRANAKTVEVVEEEKRALETRLRLMDDLRQELGEAQLQKRILEDEKKSWTTYLETQAGTEDVAYDTPEDLAKGFLQERLQRLDLLDQLGRLQPELLDREENIRTLTEELAQIKTQQASSLPTQSDEQSDGKARARLERQKNLALKEVEYLRAQMKSLEAEETEFTPEQVDQQHSQRISELEELLAQYRSELQTVQAELTKVEQQPIVQTPRKRQREDDDEEVERSSEMRRRLKATQQEAQKLQSRTTVLEAELKASAAQISSLKESSRTRVLELRSNPTAEFAAIKAATLKTLREENKALLEQLQGKPTTSKVVPVSSLESSRHELQEVKDQLAQTEKKTMRLKQIWSSKALEFREAVASILGWKLDFQPNGRVKATSILHPTTLVDGDEEENSIVFDGENGTMKISGGPKSVFAQEIQGHIDFWVDGRKEVPCFLAACTLEFYDRTTRAQKM